MSPPGSSTAEAILRDLYRFHFEVGPDGRVIGVGDSLRKIAPEIDGRPLRESITSESAMVRMSEPPAASWTGQLMRVRLIESGVQLRGAFVPAPWCGEDALFFAGTLDPEETDRLSELGLSADEFAAADLTLDFAMLRWARDAQVRETRSALMRLEESVARGRHLEALISIDPLTRLSNRVGFFQRLDAALESRNVQPVVFMVDVNRFKAINDSYGHEAGDRALVAVAKHLSAVAGERGLAARLGGDEFAIVVDTAVSDAEVAEMAEEIVALADRITVLHGSRSRIGLSVGIAVAGEGEGSRTVLAHADIAMYDARANGSSIGRFDPQTQLDLDIRRTIADDLPEALHNGDLALVYQPVVDLQSGRTDGFEVLCRWDHPVHGSLRPDVFIEVAERTRQVQELDEYVLAAAIGGAFDMIVDGELPRLAVNLSAKSLNSRLLDYLQTLLSDLDFPAHKLTVEITETASVDDLERTRSVLGGINAMGASIAVDDFGTGFASLTYLQELPVDIVKIDRSFVDSMCESTRSLQLVRSIVHVARSLGLVIVGEGIETWEQRLLLRNLGVDKAQGYHFARPLPLEEAVQTTGRMLPLQRVEGPSAATAESR